MIDRRKVHEREFIVLRSGTSMNREQVVSTLEDAGFAFIDDFACLRRREKVKRWQTETLLTCDFFHCGEAVAPIRQEFDALRFSLLVASLPLPEVTEACGIVGRFAGHLGFAVSYDGRDVTLADLDLLAAEWARDIERECGDVSGSESVAILVEMSYEHRRVEPGATANTYACHGSC